MEAHLTAPIESIEVSPDMTTLIGHGPIGGVTLPGNASALVFALGGVGTRATVRVAADAAAEPLGDAPEGPPAITLVFSRSAVERLFGWSAEPLDGCSFHLPSELREIALALRVADRAGLARITYQRAKSMELLCDAIQAFANDSLVPLATDGGMSLQDSSRVVAARQLIDERWPEKLTLGLIARSCGINRAKLTRGFRELYRCSVTEAIAERRLAEASRKLLTTDLPVSTIGYESGYLNNASFTRAFGRRFGKSPSDYRGQRLAA